MNVDERHIGLEAWPGCPSDRAFGPGGFGLPDGVVHSLSDSLALAVAWLLAGLKIWLGHDPEAGLDVDDPVEAMLRPAPGEAQLFPVWACGTHTPAYAPANWAWQVACWGRCEARQRVSRLKPIRSIKARVRAEVLAAVEVRDLRLAAACGRGLPRAPRGAGPPVRDAFRLLRATLRAMRGAGGAGP